jgi:hypothetical protein
MNCIVLNPKAKSLLYTSVEYSGFDLTNTRLWTIFCKLEPEPMRRYELLTELRRVFVTLPPDKRVKLINAKDIDNAFSWGHTPQGSTYWMDWNDRLYSFKDTL